MWERGRDGERKGREGGGLERGERGERGGRGERGEREGGTDGWMDEWETEGNVCVAFIPTLTYPDMRSQRYLEIQHEIVVPLVYQNNETANGKGIYHFRTCTLNSISAAVRPAHREYAQKTISCCLEMKCFHFWSRSANSKT